jgi:His-Xaa-Ser system protein HxsD
MKATFKNTDENDIFFDVDSSIYSINAILNAMHKFTDKYYIRSDAIGANCIRVFFKTKTGNNLFSEQITNEFYNELLEQQIRINVNEEYGEIRNEIVRKAFSPIEL